MLRPIKKSNKKMHKSLTNKAFFYDVKTVIAKAKVHSNGQNLLKMLGIKESIIRVMIQKLHN